MPHVDLETLVSAYAGGGGDRKIACETLADGNTDQPPVAEEQPDLPPESFWLSKDAEYDWFDRNAFYERKESMKANSNSNPASNSNSQRFSMNLKSKAAIIGLPKTQKASYVDTTKRRNYKPPNIQLFPKRSESVSKSAVAEPSSPKVSCMGRVRSKKGRRKPSDPPSSAARRTWIRGRCISIFRSDRKSKQAVIVEEQPPAESPPRNSSVSVRSREFTARSEAESEVEPPGLGGLKRFTSGRKSASWGAENVGFGPT